MGTWALALTNLLGSLQKQKAPNAVPYTPVNPQQSQQQAIAGNIAAQPGIEQLLAQSNKFQQGQANDLIEQAVPGYGKLSSALTQQATADASDPYGLPQDVQKNLSRLAAERGVSVGTQGQTQQFSALRDLGLNSLDYGQKRMQNAASILSTVTGVAPRVSPMSPMSFYVNPAEQINQQQFSNTRQQQTGQAGANASTAANNWNTSQGWSGFLDAILAGAKAYGNSKTPAAGTT